MRRDNEIFNLIEKERQRQTDGIELIASENFVSDQVMEAMGSILTNKYAEGYPRRRYYGGCEVVDQTEQLAIDRAKSLFGAEYVNVQPHSGAQANMAVLMACVKAGDTIMGMNLSHGGHLTHGSPVNSSGILYNVVDYSVEEDTGLINYDKMEKTALANRPKLIIGGASAYSRDWDWKRMRQIADKIGAFLMGDISHPAGFIAKGLLTDAVQYCHICTSTTHKTLRGPRGGIIIMGNNFDNPWGKLSSKGEILRMSAILDNAVFPCVQGGPLEHVIAAKAVAFRECLSEEYRDYMLQVMKNAHVMAEAFIERGYKVVSNGTDNHLMLIDLRPKFPDTIGKAAEVKLEMAGITVNKNMVPFDERSAFLASGIRVGTPAITTRGLKEDDMPIIVEMIDTVLTNIKKIKLIEKIRNDVRDMMSDRPLFVW